MEQLIAYVEQFGQLTVAQKSLVLAGVEEQTIPKGNYFVESGKICASIGFVYDGIFRSCYYNKQGDSFTRYFIYEGRFVGDINGFLDRTPSSEYIEAITDAKLWVISREYFALLESQIPAWAQLLARLNSSILENKMRAVSNMLTQDAQTRYLNFLEHYPGLANRVPQSMLASYLGITPSSLSRIRKNIT